MVSATVTVMRAVPVTWCANSIPDPDPSPRPVDPQFAASVSRSRPSFRVWVMLGKIRMELGMELGMGYDEPFYLLGRCGLHHALLQVQPGT